MQTIAVATFSASGAVFNDVNDINTFVEIKNQNQKEGLNPMNFSSSSKPRRSLGALRKANKTKPKSPDLTGPIKVQRHTIETLMKQLDETDFDEINANLAGWVNKDHSGQYLTIELSPRYVSRQQDQSPNIFDFICNDDEQENLH